MPELKVRCPQTGETVSTGISMADAAFDVAQLEDNRFLCPSCNHIHSWSKDDVIR